MSANDRKTERQPDAPATGRPDVTSTFDSMAAQVIGVAGRSTTFLSQQARTGLDEFVARFFGFSEKSLEQDKSVDRDVDKGIDR